MSEVARLALVISAAILFSVLGGSRPRFDAQVFRDPLGALEAGNERFVSGDLVHPNMDAARRTHTTKYGQKPFAIVIACSDSRVPVELLFDRGIGDLFVVRVAGNVCQTNETASVEYAVERLRTPLLVVLGHHNCGAVEGATFGARVHGVIPDLLDQIKPAAEKTRAANPNLRGQRLVAKVVKANVWQTIEDLLVRSETCRDAIGTGKLEVVGAVYDYESGRVEWLGPHPNEYELITAGR